MKGFLFCLTLLCAVSRSEAQSPEDSVKAAVNTMFRAMKTADEKLFLSVMSDSVVFQGFGRNAAGSIVIETEDVAGFASFIGKAKKDSLDEQITFDVVKVDGPLAIAWTPYKFYHNGKFSHCGVNSFQLVRLNGAWKIQYIIDTRRKDKCL